MSNNNNNNNNSNDNDPSDPSSRLSAKARLAYYLTGGTGRGPINMTSLLRMTHERNDAKKASRAWDAARRAALDELHDRWGRPGLAGRLDEARGVGPKPRGRALVRWYREVGGGAGAAGQGGRGGASADRPAQPAWDQENEPGRGGGQQQPDDDIYGVSDEEPGQREGNGGGDGHVGTGETSPRPATELVTAATVSRNRNHNLRPNIKESTGLLMSDMHLSSSEGIGSQPQCIDPAAGQNRTAPQPNQPRGQ